MVRCSIKKKKKKKKIREEFVAIEHTIDNKGDASIKNGKIKKNK